MRALLTVILILGVAPAASEEHPWEMMSGTQITQTLTGRTLEYEAAWQDFRASGRTLYNAGRNSWGYWAVRGDQYCSMWPPSDLWACYGMAQRGNAVRFIGEAGDITEGVLRD